MPSVSKHVPNGFVRPTRPTHDKRDYVESGRDGYRVVVKGLVPLLGLALLFPAVAQAEVVAPGVSEGALAVARDGSPRVAWVDGRRLLLAARDGSWRPSVLATLPTAEGRVAGVAAN